MAVTHYLPVIWKKKKLSLFLCAHAHHGDMVLPYCTCVGESHYHTIPYFGAEKKVVWKAILCYRGINTKMNSTVMQYDQQHKEPKKKLFGQEGFTHLRKRDNKRPVCASKILLAGWQAAENTPCAWAGGTFLRCLRKVPRAHSRSVTLIMNNRPLYIMSV